MFNLSDLNNGGFGITPGLGTMLSEAASVCLDVHSHPNAVPLPVDGSFTVSGPLRWSPATAQSRRAYADLQEATEWGASAVAIVIVRALMGKVVIKRSVKKTGFDYWVGDQGAPSEELFQNKARLEVSGILRGTSSDIGYRVSLKRAQVLQSGTTPVALIVIVEFSSPRARLVTQ